MNLDRIVVIGGKPGLWRIIATNPKQVIVESLEGNGSRMPVPGSAQVSVLNDITLYSTGTDPLYLRDVLAAMDKVYPDGLPLDHNSAPAKLRELFNEAAPSHDEERVYPSDMKKIVKWFAVLQPLGLLKEAPETEETAESQSQAGPSENAE